MPRTSTRSRPSRSRSTTMAPCAGVDYIASPKGQARTSMGSWRTGRTRAAAAPSTSRGGSPVDAIVQSVPCTYGSWHASSDTAALFSLTDSIWQSVSADKRGKVRAYGANSWAFGVRERRRGPSRRQPRARVAVPPRLPRQLGLASATRDRAGCRGPAVGEAPLPRVLRSSARLGEAPYAALIRRYGLLRANVEWGHDQIDPTRRTDPGPLFHSWLKGALDEIYG